MIFFLAQNENAAHRAAEERSLNARQWRYISATGGRGIRFREEDRVIVVRPETMTERRKTMYVANLVPAGLPKEARQQLEQLS